MREPRRRTEDSAEGTPEWLLTYSDLVTLVLTFFVMLYSMAVIDKQKFEQVANSLRSTFQHNSNGDMFNSNKGKNVISLIDANNVTNTEQSQVNDERSQNGESGEDTGEDNGEKARKARKLEEVKGQLQEAIIKYHLSGSVSIVEEKNFLILRLNSVILFDLGSADIKPTGEDILLKLGNMLKELDHEITIQGHTDNLPINTALFPTNWELSTKRATNVVLFLIDKCGLDPTAMTAAGNGEFQPIKPNDTEENRQQNRRIDIVIDK